jgi:hypothetical protein
MADAVAQAGNGLKSAFSGVSGIARTLAVPALVLTLVGLFTPAITLASATAAPVAGAKTIGGWFTTLFSSGADPVTQAVTGGAAAPAAAAPAAVATTPLATTGAAVAAPADALIGGHPESHIP